jgi:hypothetical protein
MSKKDALCWCDHTYVDMRDEEAYEAVLWDHSQTLSTPVIRHLITHWEGLIQIPMETSSRGKRVRELWNRAEKSRFMVDPTFTTDRSKAYVEHPYEKSLTKKLIIAGVDAGFRANLDLNLITRQVRHILDLRQDTVLMPASVNLTLPEGDGLVQKYSGTRLVDRHTGCVMEAEDIERWDNDVRRGCVRALETLGVVDFNWSAV